MNTHVTINILRLMLNFDFSINHYGIALRSSWYINSKNDKP